MIDDAQPRLLRQVAELVARVLRASTGRTFQPAPDDALLSTGQIDSLTLVDLVTALHEEFGIVLATRDLSAENFESVRAIAALVDAAGGRRNDGDPQ